MVLRYKYEYQNYKALVVWHEYYENSGIDWNKYTEVFTFTKEGEFIDGKEIGSNSTFRDTILNRIFSTTSEIRFMPNGSISVLNKHFESVLDESKVDSSQLFYVSDTTNELYEIDVNGKISYVSVH